MITFFLAALVLTTAPGSAIQLKIPNEPRLRSVQVMWQDKTVPAFQAGNVWTTILGVDLDTKPGEHRGEALLTMDDGSKERREITINVVAREFPTRRLKVAERFIDLSKADLDRTRRESKETEAIYARITTALVPDETFTVPIAGGTGRNFGERRVFNGEPRAPHSGADLRATTGTPVHATNRGSVVLAKALFFTGNTVILDHGLGIYSLYAHLSRLNVKRGEVADKGQIVGLVGATGRVTGAHLHWGMRVQGARVDPFSLVGLGFSPQNTRP
jgi:murein DD-endopeptidase MepM/ murein hydrolase activator NlpD